MQSRGSRFCRFSIHLLHQGGALTGVIWHFEQPDQSFSNHPFYIKVLPSHSERPVKLMIGDLRPSTTYRLELHRSGFHANDAYTAYLEMNSPALLSPQQVTRLNELTKDLPERNQTIQNDSTGTAQLSFPMNSIDFVLVKLRPAM